MKKIISIALFHFTLFTMQQNFTMDREQAFEECTQKCKKDMQNFIKTYQYKCKEGFFNRLRCFKKGIQAVNKFDACTNKCFKKYDEADK